MKIRAVQGLPRLNETPLAKIVYSASKVILEVDDEREARIRIMFAPYQSLKLVTSDCFDLEGGAAILRQTVMEVQDSPWIDELRLTLRSVDVEADFLEKSKHYLIPLQDDFLEVIAWGVEVERAQ